jgi:hypothetical protein
MWINKFIGILAINKKSPKDITEGILFFQCRDLQGTWKSLLRPGCISFFLVARERRHVPFREFYMLS